MHQIHETAARAALVRSLRTPLSLKLPEAVIRLGWWMARRAPHPEEFQLATALGRALGAR
jgi:hypothetical protein